MKLSLTFSVLAATFGCSAAETLFEAIAAADGDYTSLIAALTETNAEAALVALGSPVTVFGPNTAALALVTGFADLNVTQKFDILGAHVVVGEFSAATVIEEGCVELPTIVGGFIGVSYTEAGGVMVNGATVVEADIMGDGGIMHGVDSVLGDFTPCPVSFLDLAGETGKYGTLLGLIGGNQQIDDATNAALPITVFAPNDEAFKSLGGVTLAALAADETALFDVLAGHVVEGTYTAADVKAAGCVELETLAGTKLQVTYTEVHDHRALESDDEEMGMIMVNGVHVILPDIAGYDGVLHGIDEVIAAGSFTPCPAAAPSGDSAASVVSTSVAMVAAAAAFFAL